MSKEAPIITLASGKDKRLRSPSWRWDWVQSLVNRRPTPGRCSRHDDKFVKAARAFALQQKNAEDDEAKDNLRFKTPNLYYAYEFYEHIADDPEASMFLQVRLLAGQSFETIADLMGVTPDTVKWYEALFFNVTDRLNDRDWITEQVLIPALLKAPSIGTNARFQNNEVVKPFMDGSLKVFAYFGGPHLVDVMLSGCKPGSPAISQDDVNNWFDRQWSTTIRKRSAQAAVRFGINQANVMELFAVHAKIIELDRAVDAGETARTTQEKTLKTLLDQISFARGGDSGKLHAGMALPRLDAASAELCDDESDEIAAGRQAAALVEEGRNHLPELRETRAKVVYANAID